jgi:hypothetical protein
LQQYRDYCNNSCVLVHLLGSFEPAYVSTHALHMVNLIKESEENTCVKKSKLYLALGKALVKVAPPPNTRLPILNDVWKVGCNPLFANSLPLLYFFVSVSLYCLIPRRTIPALRCAVLCCAVLRCAVLLCRAQVVSKITDPEEYLEIAEVFVQYLLQNFSDREVNIFLQDVIKHVREGQAYKKLQVCRCWGCCVCWWCDGRRRVVK